MIKLVIELIGYNYYITSFFSHNILINYKLCVRNLDSMFNVKIEDSDVKYISVPDAIQLLGNASKVGGTGFRGAVEPARSQYDDARNHLHNQFINGEVRFNEGEVFDRIFQLGGDPEVLLQYHGLDQVLRVHQGEFVAVVIDDLMDWPWNGVSERVTLKEADHREKHGRHFKKRCFPVVLITRLEGGLELFRPDGHYIEPKCQDKYLYLSLGVTRMVNGPLFHPGVTGVFLEPDEVHLWHRYTTMHLCNHQPLKHWGSVKGYSQKIPKLSAKTWEQSNGVRLVVGNDAIWRMFHSKFFLKEKDLIIQGKKNRWDIVNILERTFSNFTAGDAVPI